MYWLGLVSAIFLFTSYGYLLLRVQSNVKMSMSGHAALSKRTRLYFAICHIVGTTTYNLFLAIYLVPKLQLSLWWIALLFIGTVGDWILAIFPENGKRIGKVHIIAAYMAGSLAALFVVAIALSTHTTQFTHFISILSVVVMLVIFPLSIFVPFMRKHFLIYEGLFIVFFYIATLSASYL